MAAALNIYPHPSKFTKSNQDIQSRITQLLATVVLALCMTIGLFALMERLIRVESVTLDETTSRGITPFIAEEPVIDEPGGENLIKKIELKTPPPARNMDVPMRADIGPMPIVINESVPAVPSDLGNIIAPPAPYIGSGKAIAVRQPVAKYPDRAVRAGLTGDCEVLFSLTAQGEPFNVTANCTDPVFERSAAAAVRKSAFVPARTDSGRPREAHGLVWPMEFRLAE